MNSNMLSKNGLVQDEQSSNQVLVTHVSSILDLIYDSEMGLQSLQCTVFHDYLSSITVGIFEIILSFKTTKDLKSILQT